VKIYPAIDLLNGQCVRLYQGDYNQETVYDTDPLAQVNRFVTEGAEALHVVDLNAARGDETNNRDTIARISAASPVPVQVGGGVRSAAAAEALFDAGVSRVVIGTAALRNPSLVSELASAGRSVAVGIDARGNDVAVEGWTESSGRSVSEVAAQFADVGVEALIVTEIGRDGTMEGPDRDGLTLLLGELDALGTDISLIASGGVGTLDHLVALRSVVVNGRGFEGTIVGRALYEKAFTLDEAIVVSRDGLG